jgi:hypothetical protein
MMTTTSKHDKGSPTDLRQSFRKIREDAEQATNRTELTELYKRAVYLIMMTHGSPLKEDREMKRRRLLAEIEFGRTVRTINRRAKKIDVVADFDEDWNQLATNGYESEGENLLEPQTQGVNK